jgi:methionine-rich copper-binding protein CopC
LPCERELLGGTIALLIGLSIGKLIENPRKYKMKKFKALIFASSFASAVLAAPAALAHAKLMATIPVAGTTLKAAPKEISLTFNEKIEPSFSSISVIDSKGKPVTEEKAKVDIATPAVLRLPLTQLHTGTYTVKWAVAGHDGHRRSGDFTFSVK